jgi:hypothetical protein
MRVIKIPSYMLPMNGDKEWDFARFLRATLDVDDRFNSMGPGIRASVRIENALNVATEGTFSIEEADWALLAEACETPLPKYPISPARLLAPFHAAVRDAEDLATPR